jgi:hypothetical protein
LLSVETENLVVLLSLPSNFDSFHILSTL